MKWQIQLCVHCGQIISVCNSERIIKIGQYLRKLCSNEKGSSFFLAQSVYSKLREKRLGLCRVSWCALQSFRVINWYQSIARMRFVIGYKIWSQKTRFLNGLHDDENRIILRRLVLTHYHRVTDRRTDGRTLLHSRCATKSVQRWSFSSVKQKTVSPLHVWLHCVAWMEMGRTEIGNDAVYV